MRALSTLKRLTAPLLLALALAPLLATTPAQAQGNSREATEAARKYRAEKARGNAPAPQRANATTPPRAGSEAPRTDQAYRSSANPNADPNLFGFFNYFVHSQAGCQMPHILIGIN